MLTQTCSSLPATCCTVSRRQTFDQSVRSNTSTLSAGQLSKPGSTSSHSLQLFSSSRLQKHRARVANPRHDHQQGTARQSTNSWDEAPPSDDGQNESQQASGVDWAKMQSLAVLSGASTLAAVVVLQLSGKADISRFAYGNVAESMQQALPEQLRGQQDKAPRQLFDIGAFVQTAKGEVQKEGLALQGVQKEGLALQGDPTKPDKPAAKDRVKSERQASLEKSKQVKTAKNEQNKKEKEQRQKQKDKEKEAAERKLKEQKEKERKEAEKRKKFRDQALVGGSIFGMSALTFGKWQLVASLGAVVFRTIGGPTILSSVLRTPGYIIGRGVRIVEWDVSEHPDKPDGDLVSLKLRALTPDGIRMAIAKEYGLSNYREVRQVSHWVTTATPHFFEPMRTAATFKMLPDPAFVVWSRHPPSGRHTLPTRADQAPTSDTAGTDPLAGLPTDQVTGIMLKTISGVAAASRRLAEPGHCKPGLANTQQHRRNGTSHSQSGDARISSADSAEDEHSSSQARQADGCQRQLPSPSPSSSPSRSQSPSHSSSHSSSHSTSHSAATSFQLARQESGRHAFSSAHATPSHQTHRGNGDSSSFDSSSQPSAVATRQPESSGVKGATQSASHCQQNGGSSISLDRSHGDGDHSSVQAGSRDQPQHSSESGRKDQSVTPSNGGGKEDEGAPLAAVASSSSNNANRIKSSDTTSRQELLQNEGQSGQYQSDEDEVAAALHDETDANAVSAGTKGPHYWHEPAVLQAVCGSPAVSSDAWGDKLQLASSFVPVSEAEEEALVLAVGSSGDYMLSLFRAYAPHNVITFMHYVRRHCQQT